MPPQTTQNISTLFCPHRSPKNPNIHAELASTGPTIERIRPVKAPASASLMAEMRFTKYGKIGPGAVAEKLIRHSVTTGMMNAPVVSKGQERALHVGLGRHGTRERLPDGELHDQPADDQDAAGEEERRFVAEELRRVSAQHRPDVLAAGRGNDERAQDRSRRVPSA